MKLTKGFIAAAFSDIHIVLQETYGRSNRSSALRALLVARRRDGHRFRDAAQRGLHVQLVPYLSGHDPLGVLRRRPPVRRQLLPRVLRSQANNGQRDHDLATAV